MHMGASERLMSPGRPVTWRITLDSGADLGRPTPRSCTYLHKAFRKFGQLRLLLVHSRLRRALSMGVGVAFVPLLLLPPRLQVWPT